MSGRRFIKLVFASVFAMAMAACSQSDMAGKLLPEEAEASMIAFMDALDREDKKYILANADKDLLAISGIKEKIEAMPLADYTHAGPPLSTTLIAGSKRAEASLRKGKMVSYFGTYEREFADGTNIYEFTMVRRGKQVCCKIYKFHMNIKDENKGQAEE